MRRRSRRQDIVVWSSSARLKTYHSQRFPTRGRRIRRWVRAGAVLAVIGLTGLARVARRRWRTGLLVTGGMLTVIGIVVPGSSVFVPGLVVLIFAVLKGPGATDGPAAGQLVGTRWRG